jgi:hypothetical protein
MFGINLKCYCHYINQVERFWPSEAPNKFTTPYNYGEWFDYYWSNICHGMIGVHINSLPCRFCGNILCEGKKLKNCSNCTCYGLMKIWSNFDH